MDHKEPVAAQSRQLLRPRAAGAEMPGVEQHSHVGAVHGFQDLRALREGPHGAARHRHKFQRQPHAVVRRGVREPQQRIGGLAADRRRGDPLRHVEGRDDLHAAASEHAAGRKAPVAQLAQHPPAGLGLKGNALERVQTRRTDVLLLQRLPQRLQRPAAAQITQERALAQLHGGKARLCAKHDILRQRAVFHHGHFIEAKLHFLALLCFLENFAQRAPALTRPAAHAAPHGAAFSISCAIRAAHARAPPPLCRPARPPAPRRPHRMIFVSSYHIFPALPRVRQARYAFRAAKTYISGRLFAPAQILWYALFCKIVGKQVASPRILE